MPVEWSVPVNLARGVGHNPGPRIELAVTASGLARACRGYSTVNVLVSTWIGCPFSAEDSKARIS